MTKAKVKTAARLGLALLVLGALTAPPADAANPTRSQFREGKADFHDKELSLTYGFGGGGSLDFAFTDALSLGVAVDRVTNANDWFYRMTYRLMDNPDNGLQIALNAGALNTRERLAGDLIAPPVWGYQTGLLVSFLTDSGLIFRAGFQLYDTEWGAPGGQQFLFTPEIAYQWSLLEITLQPSGPPFSFGDVNWVGLRVRI